MVRQTHYEVLVKQNGRWEIHGRHQASGKEAAIEEAKALDGQTHIERVKVIQGIFDAEEGTSKEYNVYAPGQKKYQPPRKSSKKNPKTAKSSTRNFLPTRKSLAGRLAKFLCILP